MCYPYEIKTIIIIIIIIIINIIFINFLIWNMRGCQATADKAISTNFKSKIVYLVE